MFTYYVHLLCSPNLYKVARHDTYFRAPCGRKFRSFPEVARFLLQVRVR